MIQCVDDRTRFVMTNWWLPIIYFFSQFFSTSLLIILSIISVIVERELLGLNFFSIETDIRRFYSSTINFPLPQLILPDAHATGTLRIGPGDPQCDSGQSGQHHVASAERTEPKRSIWRCSGPSKLDGVIPAASKPKATVSAYQSIIISMHCLWCVCVCLFVFRQRTVEQQLNISTALNFSLAIMLMTSVLYMWCLCSSHWARPEFIWFFVFQYVPTFKNLLRLRLAPVSAVSLTSSYCHTFFPLFFSCFFWFWLWVVGVFPVSNFRKSHWSSLQSDPHSPYTVYY